MAALIEERRKEDDPEEFWQRVKTNLQAGKVRLIFVADVIPYELKGIVEFLNEQMDPARSFFPLSGGLETNGYFDLDSLHFFPNDKCKCVCE